MDINTRPSVINNPTSNQPTLLSKLRENEDQALHASQISNHLLQGLLPQVLLQMQMTEDKHGNTSVAVQLPTTAHQRLQIPEVPPSRNLPLLSLV
jgi:hypothetical protein